MTGPLGICLAAWLRGRGLRWRPCRSGCRRAGHDQCGYVAGRGCLALLRIGHHLADPIAPWLQLKGHVDTYPGLEKFRQLCIRNIYGCVPLLGNHQVSLFVEDAKNKGQRIQVMVRFLSQME